jgi:hypothetical protein
MGRPISNNFLGTVGSTTVNAVHQIQSTTWGAKDTSAVQGYLTKQNSTSRFAATTAKGTSMTTLSNGTPISAGYSAVKVFPVGNDPIVYANATAKLKAVSATLVNGGGTYHANDVLSFVGGTSAHAANVTVNTVGANNTIATFTLNVSGTNQQYTALPANIAGVATTDTTNANGTGAIFSVNFGLESVAITGGGLNYTGANIILPQATINPTTTATIVGGVVQNSVVVNTPGVVNVGNPTVVVEGTSGTTEYAKKIQSSTQVLTHSGNVYTWLPRGATVPSDYSNLSVKLAFLDTL